jgi:exodeoxyribonuclease VII large subunit
MSFTAQRAAGAPPSRVQTVGEFTRQVKTLLESGLPPCWVKGEVSNLKFQASGHIYFSLKDADAQVSAVLFRGDAARQTVRLRDGMQILVFGQISVYEPRGQYQLIVRAVIEDGVGRLQQEFEALKRKLAAEGLFAAENKQALPVHPLCVGFITSPTGAAVQDFLRILQRRAWKGRVVVLSCKVQGQGAAEEMASMLSYAQGMRREDSDQPLFDMLVIGRGGGSLEDLWAFNEEVLVRAVAACDLPIISAVGHEIDFTLCDFAADVRAETPSAAAELISSSFLALLEQLRHAQRSLLNFTDQGVAAARAAFDPLKSRLRLLSPATQIERGYLRLDDLSNRLDSALRHSLQLKRQELSALGNLQQSLDKGMTAARASLDPLRSRLRLLAPAAQIERGQLRLKAFSGRLESAFRHKLQLKRQELQLLQSGLAQRSPQRRIEMESQRLLSLWKRLQAASPQSVLNRGYVIMRDQEGRPLLRRKELKPGAQVEAQFADGQAKLRAED